MKNKLKEHFIVFGFADFTSSYLIRYWAAEPKKEKLIKKFKKLLAEAEKSGDDISYEELVTEGMNKSRLKWEFVPYSLLEEWDLYQ